MILSKVAHSNFLVQQVGVFDCVLAVCLRPSQSHSLRQVRCKTQKCHNRNREILTIGKRKPSIVTFCHYRYIKDP